MEYVVGAASPGSDEIEYEMHDDGVPGGVEYDVEPESGVEYVVTAPGESTMSEAVDYQLPEGEEVESVIELPYLADAALEEAPYDELVKLIKRSKELLERAQGRVPAPVIPGQVPKVQPAAQPAVQQPPQPEPAQPGAAQPAPRVEPTPPEKVTPVEPKVAPVVETIPILPPEQYERNALNALDAMKAALGGSV